jgi:hypothetical protein
VRVCACVVGHLWLWSHPAGTILAVSQIDKEEELLCRVRFGEANPGFLRRFFAFELTAFLHFLREDYHVQDADLSSCSCSARGADQ